MFGDTVKITDPDVLTIARAAQEAATAAGQGMILLAQERDRAIRRMWAHLHEAYPQLAWQQRVYEFDTDEGTITDIGPHPAFHAADPAPSAPSSAPSQASTEAAGL